MIKFYFLVLILFFRFTQRIVKIPEQDLHVMGIETQIKQGQSKFNIIKISDSKFLHNDITLIHVLQ